MSDRDFAHELDEVCGAVEYRCAIPFTPKGLGEELRCSLALGHPSRCSWNYADERTWGRGGVRRAE